MSAEAFQRRMSGIWRQVLLRGGISLTLGLLMLALPHASVRTYQKFSGLMPSRTAYC